MNRGRIQEIRVESVPPGARVQVQPDGQTAVTPALVGLVRKRGHLITVEREGYAPVSIDITRKRSASVMGNFIWLHPAAIIAGFIVDLSTGSGYNLSPDHVAVTLTPVSKQSAAR